VIGGGVVGLACALTLARTGHRVALYDPADPGTGCSFGNAGLIATSEVYPLLNAARLTSLPRMLADPLGPLAFRAASLPRLLPWFWRALAIMPTARQEAVARSNSMLNKDALTAWRDLLRFAGAPQLLIERGMIEVVRAPQRADCLRHDQMKMALHGFMTEILDAAEVEDLEPALTGRISGALFHPATAHVQDPYAISLAMAKAFRASGGTILRATVQKLRPGLDRNVLETDLGPFDARRVVICAGIGSRGLLEPFDLKIPITPERGYHLMLPSFGDLLTRPVVFRRESFVATPMRGGLRLAGTVEFADDSSTPNWRRSDQLQKLAERYLGPLPPEAGSRWIGSRPSLPDFMPAIGKLPHWPSITYAFGHQHLGLTQAAITACHIRDLVEGKDMAILRPFDLSRFS
jgi:D-hydroxyproline dehydrogenase